MTLYISKNVEDIDFLNFIREKSIDLIAISMITFKTAAFVVPKKSEYEAVFFTSPRAVRFFLERVDLAEDVFIGAIGKSTANFIYQQGYSVHFTGIQSGKPKEVAKSFNAAVGNRKTLFPQSSRSKKSVQKYLNTEQCIDLVVYETLLEPRELKNAPDILVFTSPSNVEAYLKKNDIVDKQKIVAWGDSTALYLKDRGCLVSHTLEKSNLKELQVTLNKMLDASN